MMFGPWHTGLPSAVFSHTIPHGAKPLRTKSLSSAVTEAEARVSSMKVAKHSLDTPNAVKSMPTSKNPFFGIVPAVVRDLALYDQAGWPLTVPQLLGITTGAPFCLPVAVNGFCVSAPVMSHKVCPDWIRPWRVFAQ